MNQHTASPIKVVFPIKEVNPSSEDAQRFWQHVLVSSPEECWNWTGSQFASGYGEFRMNKWPFRAHRVSWAIAHGPLTKDDLVLHKCDNPLCCNPSHLFLGTHSDNRQDCCSKGRQAKGNTHGSVIHPERVPRGDRHGLRMHPEKAAHGDRNGARIHPERLARGDQHHFRLRPELAPRGSRNSHAKLNEDQVREMRLKFQNGSSVDELMGLYGISRANTWKIVRRTLWRHC